MTLEVFTADALRPRGEVVSTSSADPAVCGVVADLFNEHSRGLVRRLTRQTGCNEVASELVQEAFVKLLRMPAATLRGIERPEFYVTRIAINLARDLNRKRRYQKRVIASLELAPEHQLDQVNVLEARDQLRRVARSLNQLRPNTRAIFVARRLHGLSYAEISEVTGLSAKGIEKQMTKGLAKVRKLQAQR